MCVYIYVYVYIYIYIYIYIYAYQLYTHKLVLKVGRKTVDYIVFFSIEGHVWTDGTPVSYTNWEIGQPDGYNGREACTQLYNEVGYWGDVNCYDRKPYVCERRGKFCRIDNINHFLLY